MEGPHLRLGARAHVSAILTGSFSVYFLNLSVLEAQYVIAHFRKFCSSFHSRVIHSFVYAGGRVVVIITLIPCPLGPV